MESGEEAQEGTWKPLGPPRSHGWKRKSVLVFTRQWCVPMGARNLFVNAGKMFFLLSSKLYGEGKRVNRFTVPATTG